MSDLYLDPSVGRLVRAWIEKFDPVSTCDSESEKRGGQATKFSPRPARLGLGATYVPHMHSVSEADKRLAGSLRKQKREALRDGPDTMGDLEQGESRAAVVGLGRKKPRKRVRSRKPSLPPAAVGEELNRNSAEDDDFGRPEHENHFKMDVMHQQLEKVTPWSTYKRKKIRSRQKNLKRDKRTKDELPSYLTDETLRGGRLHRDIS